MEVCGNQCRHRSSICFNVNYDRLWSLQLFHSANLSSNRRKCFQRRRWISWSICSLSRLPLTKSRFFQSSDQIKLSKTFSGNWSTREVFSRKIWDGPKRSPSTQTGMRHLFRLKFVLTATLNTPKLNIDTSLIYFFRIVSFSEREEAGGIPSGRGSISILSTSVRAFVVCPLFRLRYGWPIRCVRLIW